MISPYEFIPFFSLLVGRVSVLDQFEFLKIKWSLYMEKNEKCIFIFNVFIFNIVN